MTATIVTMHARCELCAELADEIDAYTGIGLPGRVDTLRDELARHLANDES